MNNKVVMIVVGAILLLTAGFFIFKDRLGIKSDNNSVDNVVKNTITAIITSGESYQCSYSSESEGSVETANTYIAKGGDRQYMNYTTESNGMTTQHYMVVKDGYSYTWDSNSTEGYKFKITKSEGGKIEFEASEDTDNSNDVFEQAYDYEYDCKPWVVQESRFDLPSGITFIDVQAQIDESLEEMKQYCSTCDQLEGEARTQCLVSLKCEM